VKLRTKLVGGTILLVVLLGTGLIYLLRSTFAARLETELQRRGVSIAKFVADDSEKLMLTEDAVALLLLAEGSRRIEEDISYIFIQDAAGAVMVHTFGDSFPTGLLRVNALAADGRPSVRKLATAMGTIYDVAVGVGDDDPGPLLGTVRVGILGTSIDRGVAAVLYNGAGITVASLLLFGAVALWADLVVTRSIEALGAGTKALGHGDLDYRIPVRGSGEFAELAGAFNAMADNIRGSEGQLVDLNTTLLREVRDRTAAETGLRHSLERYAALFGSVSDAIYVHAVTGDGRPGRIVEVNDAGCARLGFTRAEMLAMTIEQIDAPETDAAESAALAARLRAGETVVFERVHCGKGGRRVPVEVSSRVFDLDGVPMALSICRDITDRNLAREELHRANAELERQNTELKKLDRLREGFVRDVSHELKTPVAKHAMQLEILRDIAEREGFAPAIAKVGAVMESSIRRQQQVIRNLLGLARLESGARGYRRDPVRLDQVVRGVIDDYQPESSARGIVVDVDLAPVEITSDAEMLWHVFSNLFNNALKFQKSPVGGTVRVALAIEGGAAVVRVRDEGIGLTADELARVFDRFYQVTASAEGSGVGLTICRMIVEGVGGSIRFESAGRGTGATAVVTLPIEGGVTSA
jgi:PAS domain S-box-containing protein